MGAVTSPLAKRNADRCAVSMWRTVKNEPCGTTGGTAPSRESRDAAQVEAGQTADEFLVKGRGMLHLGILIENMRREGFEFQVGPPKVIIKVVDGHKHEPFEEATVDVPEEYVGSCVDLLGSRKGTMLDMNTMNVCAPARAPARTAA
jgi:predicted membrane GTPase involved in stress response